MAARITRHSRSIRRGIVQDLAKKRSAKRAKKSVNAEACTCGEDRPRAAMLSCGICHRFYHFQCVNLDEGQVEEIAYYVCPTCTVATGKISREFWELDDDEVPEIQLEEDVFESPFQHSSDEEGSEDDFVEDPKSAPAPNAKTDNSDDDTITARTHKKVTRKRKSISNPADSSAKRHRTDELPESASSNDPADNPIRKSCLKLLVNLLDPIFSERLPDEPDPPVKSGTAEQFALALEACVFDIYCESSEFGDRTPGNKYKDRVRMLNFNLGKKDRQELRKSIRVGLITPDQLSRMSSIDLANAQAQEEAHKLTEEAMNHSILQARTAPLRKTTHKGEQMIEKTVDEESWRIQEEDLARERQRESQRESQRSRVGSVSESVPPVTPVSETFRRPSLDFVSSASPPAPAPTDKAFDPASTVFNIDFDGEGSSMLDNGPAAPPELSGEITEPGDTILGGDTHNSPSSPTTSPVAQNFSLEGLFGSSRSPPRPNWKELPEAEASTGPHSIAEDQHQDDTNFDEFITVEEDEDIPEPTPQEPEPVTPIVESPPAEPQFSLANTPSIWLGHLAMPSVIDPGRIIRFQAGFKQVGGAPFNDTLENRRALFPTGYFDIVGRVPTAQADKYLVSIRLNPTKELIAVALIPSEGDRAAYDELHKMLVDKDRYGLAFPWGTDPQLSAPGKEFYIAPLRPERPIPECLQLMDNVKLPNKPDSPIFCGFFVLNKGRVTSLNSAENSYYHAAPAVPAASRSSSIHPPPPGHGTVAPAPVVPGSPVTVPGIPAAVTPSLASSLSNLSKTTLETLSKDLANLNSTQLDLVRALLWNQGPAPAAPAPPAPPIPPAAGDHYPMSHIPPYPPVPGPSHSGPASWDRPPELNWIPGPGYYARDGHREERPFHGPSEGRGEPRTPRGRTRDSGWGARGRGGRR